MLNVNSDSPEIVRLSDIVAHGNYPCAGKKTPYSFAKFCDVPPNTVYRLLELDLIFIDDEPYFPVDYAPDSNKGWVIESSLALVLSTKLVLRGLLQLPENPL